jgi:hypothetical protein
LFVPATLLTCVYDGIQQGHKVTSLPR